MTPRPLGLLTHYFQKESMKHRLRDAQWERREFDLVAYILWMGIVMSREGHQPAQIPGGPDHLGHNPGIFLILAAAWDITMPVSQRKMLDKLSLSERMNVYLSNQTVSSVRTGLFFVHLFTINNWCRNLDTHLLLLQIRSDQSLSHVRFFSTP